MWASSLPAHSETEPLGAYDLPVSAAKKPTQSIGRIKGMMTTADGMRRGMNLWPPFLFTGIRIREVSEDLRRVVVTLKKSPLNSNYFGTQFGGSMFSMTDPFWAILVVRALGEDYTVWDQAGSIDFVRPGRTDLSVTFELTEAVVEQLRAEAASGQKVLQWFETEIVDASGELVARVRKQLYIRKKPNAA